MRLFFAAAALVMAAPTLAAAATVQLPATGKPVATITVPDGWSHKVVEGEVISLQPKDETIEVVVSYEARHMTQDQRLQDFEKIVPPNSQIVPGSVKLSKIMVNGRPATVTRLQMSEKGKQPDIDFTITAIATKSGDVQVSTNGTAQLLKPHEAEVGAIIESVKIND